MTQKEMELLKSIPGREHLYVIMSMSTRLPFAKCNDETCDDENFFFTDKEQAIAGAKVFKDQQYNVAVADLQNKDFLRAFTEAAAQGINCFVFKDGEEEYHIPIEKIVKKKPVEEMPNKQAPIENPALSMSMVYYLQEARKPKEIAQQNKELINELAEEAIANVARATLLVPMLPVEGTNNLSVIHIKNNKDENKLPMVPIFTDIPEFVKAQKIITNQGVRLVPVGVDKIVSFLEHFQKENDPHVAILNIGSFDLAFTLENMKMIQRDFVAKDE